MRAAVRMREAASSRRRPALLLPTVQDDEPDHAGVHPFGEHRRLDGQRAGLVDGRVVGRHFGLALGRPPSSYLRRCLVPGIDATIGSSPGQRAASSAVGSIAGCNGLGYASLCFQAASRAVHSKPAEKWAPAAMDAVRREAPSLRIGISTRGAPTLHPDRR